MGSISEEKKRRRHNVDTPKGNIILSEYELDSKSEDKTSAATKTKDNIAKPGRKSKSGTAKIGGVSKEDPSKIGNAQSEASTPGPRAKDSVTGTARKLKLIIAFPGKSRSKPDAKGSVKVKGGSSKRLQTMHVVTKVIVNVGVPQESEEKSGKKRPNKSHS